jgi:predicted aspartyl protease
LLLGFPVLLRAEADPMKGFDALITQSGYYQMPVDNSGMNNQKVEVAINGKQVRLIIDTGAPRTIITARCAQHLNLDVIDTGEKTNGVGGIVDGTLGIALIKSVTLNNLEINRLNTVEVLPKTSPWNEADGLLGFDYLHLNAVILPVGGSLFLFKPNTRMPPQIDHFMEQLGFKSIPLEYAKGGLRVTGHLNGHPLTALLDCGAAFSDFDLDYIRQIAGARTNELNMVGRGVDGRGIRIYGFTPKELGFGSITLRPFELAANQGPIFADKGVNALLGCDLLATHHAIVDLGHDVLWLK